jgi:hypothetical protein
MTTVSERAVRQVLRDRILNIEGVVPSERWVFQNRVEDAPNTSAALSKEDALFIEEFVGITAEQRSSKDEVNVFGRAKYLIVSAVGAGSEAAEDMAALIVGDLQGVTYLQGQGVTIYLERPERLSPFPDGDWWYKPVEVSWRAHSFETQQVT